MSDLGDHSPLRYGPTPTTAPQPDPPAASTRHTPGMPPAAWPLAVLVGAAVAGVLGGAVVGLASYSGTGEGDDWSELGAILLGLVAGLVVFGVSYVVGLVLAARRAFPDGRRALPVVLAFGIPAAFGALVIGLRDVAEQLDADLVPAVGVVVGLAVIAAAPLAFGLAGTAAGRRRLTVILAAAAVLVVAVSGVGIGVERARTSRVVAQLPLVLFDGRTADAPFAGWRRDVFSTVWVNESRRTFTEKGHSAYLKYLSGGGAVFVTMYTEVGACTDTTAYLCRVVGTADGGEQRTYTRVARYGSYPRSASFAVLAYPDGSAVSVDAPEPGRTTATSPDEVLRSLVRVDRQTFERATGSALRVR